MKSSILLKSSMTSLLLFSLLGLTACGEEKMPAPAQTAAPSPMEVMKTTDANQAEKPQAAEAAKADEAPKAPVEAASLAEGKALYEKTCRICHDTGMLASPKLSNKAEWQKRLSEKGLDTLHQHSAHGFNHMPAQAVNGVTEAQVYAAVDYMLEQAK